jgi:hypothetical protein
MSVDVKNLNYDLVQKFKSGYEFVKPTNGLEKFHNPSFAIHKNKNLLQLFVYKDSFFDDLMWFTSEHFSQSIYINEFPCDLNYEIIKKYHPDIVIQEFWEGRVAGVLSQCETFSKS